VIAYVDSSILLRLALKQPGALKDFSKIQRGISSRILKAECLRTLDRLLAFETISDKDQSAASLYLYQAFDHIEQIPVEPLLDSVGNPMGLKLGTLDALHLVSALKWREGKRAGIMFLTHDERLGQAAERFGFRVLGL